MPGAVEHVPECGVQDAVREALRPPAHTSLLYSAVKRPDRSRDRARENTTGVPHIPQPLTPPHTPT
jgi:hypothetical protein